MYKQMSLLKGDDALMYIFIKQVNCVKDFALIIALQYSSHLYRV